MSELLSTKSSKGFCDKKNIDYQKMEFIVREMDLLRKKAIESNYPEMVTLVESAFNVCLTSYYLALRLGTLPQTEN